MTGYELNSYFALYHDRECDLCPDLDRLQVRIQEVTDEEGGRVPRTIEVELTQDTCDTCMPGTVVVVYNWYCCCCLKLSPTLLIPSPYPYFKVPQFFLYPFPFHYPYSTIPVTSNPSVPFLLIIPNLHTFNCLVCLMVTMLSSLTRDDNQF